VSPISSSTPRNSARLLMWLDLNRMRDNEQHVGHASSKGCGFLSSICGQLVRQAVGEICMVTTSRDESTEALTELPSFVRRRVRLVDKELRVSKEVSALLSPVRDETEWLLRHGRLDLAKLYFKDHVHDVCQLSEGLRVLVLAQRLRADADVDTKCLLRCARRLRAVVADGESGAILDRIEGVLTAYDVGLSVPILSETSTHPGELLRDLLDDARMEQLSKCRSSLGIPGRVAEAMVQARRFVRKLVSDPRYNPFVRLGTQSVQRVSRGVLPDIGLPGLLTGAPPFVPVAYTLDRLVPPCLRFQSEEGSGPVHCVPVSDVSKWKNRKDGGTHLVASRASFAGTRRGKD
jgi:hypothetical protein